MVEEMVEVSAKIRGGTGDKKKTKKVEEREKEK